MNRLELDIGPSAYELRLDGNVLARLEGGSATLLSGAGERLRDIDMESAIERSEEWLMPSSRLFEGLELRVRDGTGRLRRCLCVQASFTPTQIEQAFNRAFDAVAHARAIEPDCVADVVLLRELVHHAKLAGIVLD